MKKVLFLVLISFSFVGNAASSLKADCRIDTVKGVSIPRQIELADGMRTDISCNVDSCKDPMLTIVMNYNSLYSAVSLSIYDKKLDLATETQFANLKKGSKINFINYSVSAQRQLRIDCDIL